MMIPAHEVQDEGKVEEIRQSLEQNGWQGTPLVTWDEYLLTGVHRYAAARRLAMVDYEIPTITIQEVFEEAGLDFDALHAEYDYPTATEIWFSGMLDRLPTEIHEKYGIQY